MREPRYVENNFKPILADWDMDGDLDLALIHPKSSRFFEHQSDGKVIEISEPPSNYSCPIAWRHYFSMTDFDGDGLLDLLGFGSNVKPIVCRRVGSDFVFMPAESTLMLEGFREGFGASAFLVGFPTFLDWDGDGDVDILKLEGNKLCLQEQLSNGTFHARLLPVPMARDFFAVDFDGDGDVSRPKPFSPAHVGPLTRLNLCNTVGVFAVLHIWAQVVVFENMAKENWTGSLRSWLLV